MTIYCENQVFNYYGSTPSFIIIIILHTILALGIVFLMCRLCTKAFSYSNYHIHEAYKFYIITLFATILIILTRLTQYTLKSMDDQQVPQWQKRGWIVLNQIMGSCSILAMNQAYAQNGFTWLMIYLGCDFSGHGSSQNMNIGESTIKKQKIAKRSKNIVLYGILPVLCILVLIFLLFQNKWCDVSEVLIIISTIFSIFAIIVPLLLLLKSRWKDPVTPKATKMTWIYIVFSVTLRQVFLMILLLTTLISDDSHNPDFLSQDPFGIIYVFVLTIAPTLCMIYLAERQLQKQNVPILKGTSAMAYGSVIM